MPRAKVDVEAITDRLLDDAELMLRQNRGKQLILSEIASNAGMSQSNIHRFFPTKVDLIRALAKRWFSEIEQESRRIVDLKTDASQRLEKWVLTILRIKRERYDADPELFNAYLTLSIGHMDIVHQHTGRLHTDLRSIVADIVSSDVLEATVAVIEDVTLLFRTPQNIANYRKSATDERAQAVVNLVLAAIR